MNVSGKSFAEVDFQPANERPVLLFLVLVEIEKSHDKKTTTDPPVIYSTLFFCSPNHCYYNSYLVQFRQLALLLLDVIFIINKVFHIELVFP